MNAEGKMALVLPIILALLMPARVNGKSFQGWSTSPPDVGLWPVLDGPAHQPRQQSPDGLWFIPGREDRGAPPTVAPQTSGGPDSFGYVWDDGVPFTWVDLTSRIDTGLDGANQEVGPIPLPFLFRFYEHEYQKIYISSNGTLGFDGGLTLDRQEMQFPNPGLPNNVIAPYWAPEDASTGGVYYSGGGAAPNRWWAVEWHQMRDMGADSHLTFEAVLFENGDIEFRFLTLEYGSGSYWQAGVGIEDAAGLDGLAYEGRPAPGRSIRFARPAPSARVAVQPNHQGHLTKAGEEVAFPVQVRNSGELGADTYELSATSAWPVSFFATDGRTPLTDTDADGTVDTGLLDQGISTTIVTKVTTPPLVNVGDDNTAAVHVESSQDAVQSQTVYLRTAIPAPFAQVFRDDANGALTLYLAQPEGQVHYKVTTDWYNGFSTAVAETPDGFAYAWVRRRQESGHSVEEIEYTLLDREGRTLRAIDRLAEHIGATNNVWDRAPALALAPQGQIGILWVRQLSDSSSGASNYNILFAVLGAEGDLIYGPQDLTGNGAWGTWDDYDVPIFQAPRLATTDNGRFVLAWTRQDQFPPSEACTQNCSISDIYVAVRDAAGSEILPITRFTSDTPGVDEGFGSPCLARLRGGRALLAWRQESTGDLLYAVLDSAGAIVRPESNLSGGTGWASVPDAVTLASGHTLIAWAAQQDAQEQTMIAVLDGSQRRIAGPTALDNPAARSGSDFVSVAADATGHAILTWMDDSPSLRNLYYALVDTSGVVLTEPTIVRSSQSTVPWLFTSSWGHGNTSYGLVTSPGSGVDAWVLAPEQVEGQLGRPIGIEVSLGNRGLTPATSARLTAELEGDLDYTSAQPAPASVTGNRVIWELPDLAFLGGGSVALSVTVRTSTIGQHGAVRWALTSDGPEIYPADNAATTEILAGVKLFLPLVSKSG